jgi:hypothetical protein
MQPETNNPNPQANQPTKQPKKLQLLMLKKTTPAHQKLNNSQNLVFTRTLTVCY